jgi:hypothetical protein
LAVVAVLAASCGYAAAKWSTESSLSLSRASAARAEANAANLAALNAVNFDVTERSSKPWVSCMLSVFRMKS